MPEKIDKEKQVLKTIKELQQQIVHQEQLLNEVLIEIKKEQTPSQTSKEQEQLLNEILVEIKKDTVPSPLRPTKSPFSIVENLDLDMEKLTKIALFISSLYIKSNEDKVQSSSEE